MTISEARETALQLLDERVGLDPNALLRCIAPLVDDAALREIAECDYEMDVELNFWRLQKIRDLEPIPAPLDWNPGEVLHLTRWLEPGRSNGMPRRIHVKRAFACAVLIRAADDPRTWQCECAEETTLTQLIESAVWLGSPTPLAALRSIAASAKSRESLDDQYWFALGLLMLAAVSKETGNDSAMHEALLDWYVAERNELSELERHERDWVDLHRSSHCGLKWINLAMTCLIEPFRGAPATYAPDGRLMVAARSEKHTSSAADQLIALGTEFSRARWTD